MCIKQCRARTRLNGYVCLFAIAVLQLAVSRTAHGFGATAHRAIGLIADRHLTAQTRAAVKAIIGRETLAEVSTWADEIRSDPAYKHASSWHWVTIEDGQTYESSRKNPNGDVVEAIRRHTAILRSSRSTKRERAEALKWVVHLVGDIHQPLHVGRGPDRGGNEIRCKWFGRTTNIHSVWDSKMVDSTKLSFTELANTCDKTTAEQRKEWQASTVLDWANESIKHRKQVYAVPDDSTSGSYAYSYKNLPLVKTRISQAGVRLAGLLNGIFDQ